MDGTGVNDHEEDGEITEMDFHVMKDKFGEDLTLISAVMSSRRRSRARISEEEMNELITKLQSLLPESRRQTTERASAGKLLKETCSYIKRLKREVEDLSEQLATLMSTMENDSPQAEIIRNLLR